MLSYFVCVCVLSCTEYMYTVVQQSRQPIFSWITRSKWTHFNNFWYAEYWRITHQMLLICPPHLQHVANVPWKIQKKSFVSNKSSWTFAVATGQVLRAWSCVYFFDCWETVYCELNTTVQHRRVITFRVRHSRGKMYIGHLSLCVCVCLSIAAFPHYTRTQM